VLIKLLLFKMFIGSKSRRFTLFFEAHHSTRTKVCMDMIFTARYSFKIKIKAKWSQNLKIDHLS
jgi:hypothetical protein